MTKFNLEKCKSGNKGITLIALVITIIVLLILAGITISALTGSDSAPARANEAKQKQDIGSAKDQIAIVAQNAHLEAYDDIYVKNNNAVSSTAATTTVGQRVINAVLDQYKAEKNAKVGDASIVVAQTAAGQDASITITTRDFTQLGSISYAGGVLTWQALTENGGGQQGGNGGSGSENTVQALAKAGQIQRWDKINYNPGNGTTASIDLPDGASIEGEKLASLSLPSGASLDGTINASDASDWVVLDVNTTTGEVKIMPRTVSSAELTLSGMDGYNNAIQALDAVAGIYLNPAYATNAKSITYDDVYNNVKSFGGMVDFWLAESSRMIQHVDGRMEYYVEYFSSNSCDFGSIALYDAYAYSMDNCVIPVVTLKSDIQLESDSKFYTETATATQTVSNPTEEEKESLFEHNTWSFK